MEKKTRDCLSNYENDPNPPALVTKAYMHRLFGEFEVRMLNRFMSFIALNCSHEVEEWSDP
jgi:hypothetical protein